MSTESNQSRALSRVERLNDRIGDLQIEISVEQAKLDLISAENSEAAGVEVVEVAATLPPMPDFARGEVSEAELSMAVEKDASVVRAMGEVNRFERLIIQMEDSGLDRLYQTDYRERVRKRNEAQEALQGVRETAREALLVEMEKALDADVERRKAGMARTAVASRPGSKVRERGTQQKAANGAA